MKIDEEKVESFLNLLKERAKIISGGSKNKLRPSYILRDPDYYWDFGSFLVEQAQKIDEEKRRRWITKQTMTIEKNILGPIRNDEWLTPKIYTWVNELEDKEHFMYVADLAGHKNGSFRFKVMEYILEIFSKKHPSSYSEVKKEKLAKKLLEKKLQHLGEEGINSILKEFRGKTSLGYGIRNSYDSLSNGIGNVIEKDTPNERKTLRNEIGKNMIDKLRTYLQILSLTDYSFYQEMVSDYKSELNRKILTKNQDAKKLDQVFGKCIKDKNLKQRIMTLINAYEMGELNTELNALESEENYDEWKRTKDNFAQMEF